jgi:hypothetical protein
MEDAESYEKFRVAAYNMFYDDSFGKQPTLKQRKEKQ